MSQPSALLTGSVPAPPAADTAPARDAVVRVSGLSKIFKDFWGRPKARAVDNVAFEVRRGEVFGLLGPNGSGKSTTVKMLLGLLYPTKGVIEVFGRSPRHVATKARIGYLPEESYLYRYLDSRETLDFFGNLFQLPADKRKDRTEQLLEMVGLKNVQRRVVGEFSKGMQRRIGLAQALINDPDLVILDEPTSGLDPIGCREVKDVILALARRGKTVILSSHLLADVQDVCDRVVIYYGGRIQAMGSLSELLTERDSIRITAPVLPRATLERVLEILRAEAPSADAIRLDSPTQNLESYFLGVVQRARAAEAQTSGATSGGRVAAYLQSGTPASPADGDRLLDRLAAPVVPATPAPAPAPAPAAPEPDETRLAKLAQSAARPEPESTPAAPAAKPPAEELSKADDKLSSLLGGRPQ
ncbi:MAG: ABC transporter ATP-binding protein [Verrucomicrobiae bacterium]|nr:ABC transporter ATP-binding protein [Verrucomicrobiae bacterium]